MQAVAHSARDRLIESWNDTEQHFQKVNPKRVYYLSMEFLMGEPPHLMHFNLMNAPITCICHPHSCPPIPRQTEISMFIGGLQSALLDTICVVMEVL